MNTFVNAVINQEAYTENGMKARKSTANAVVDLFYSAGSSRSVDIVPAFSAAYAEDRDLALRVAAWVRDVRGGAGERQTFRNILSYLEKTDTEAAKALLKKVPEIGRWDDIFVFQTQQMKNEAYTMLRDALKNGNGLAAKWTPRQGALAVELRKFFGMSPKFYRKTLVELTRVIETQMCAKQWDEINFSHVPSVAAARYKKAFNRNTPKYAEYVKALVKAEDKSIKVNAQAIFPHDVLRGRISPAYAKVPPFDETELNLIEKQWEALPNYVGSANVLALVDVSASMLAPVDSKSKLTCLEVSVSLGLYVADKNTGKFKDTFLTFSTMPELVYLKGNINQKIDQMVGSKWEMSTDLNAAFDKILDVAVKGQVPQSEMPETLLILSDMQFDRCVVYNDSAIEMIERKYAKAGYKVPRVVFWNLNGSYENVPVAQDKSGAALVSGFSPAIMKSILSSDMDALTPMSIMLGTIMQDRYKVI